MTKGDDVLMGSFTRKELAVLFWATRKKNLTTFRPGRTHGTVLWRRHNYDWIMHRLGRTAQSLNGSGLRVARRVMRKITRASARHPLEQLALA